ncbi:hypothetical protein TSOC_015199, partial [Tetrabaena socialis]
AAGALLVVKQQLRSSCAGQLRSSCAGVAGGAWDPSSAASAGMSEEEVAALQGSWAYMSSSAFPAESRDKMEAFGVEFFLALFDQFPVLLTLFHFKDSKASARGGSPLRPQPCASRSCMTVRGARMRLAWL